jgi:hypothetical protein
MMFGRKKADVVPAGRETQDVISKRQEKLTCANEMRKRAAKLLSESAKATRESFYEEVGMIIKKFEPVLKTALKGAQRRETNVSRTYIIEGNPELFEKFEKISGKYGIINVDVKKSMGKIYVNFEIAE